MKRRFKILSAAIAAVSALFVFAACGGGEQHNYKKTVIEPTCTESGYTLYECTDDGCDNEYKDNAVAALGHSYDDNFCVRCGILNSAAPDTEGLQYEPVYDEDESKVEGYSVVNVGEASIGNYIKINGTHAEEINGKEEKKPVVKIGDGVFENLSAVKAVVLPDSVKEIGERAFYGCSAVEDLSVPVNVKQIGFGAFGGCSSLKNMTLPYAAGKTVNGDDGKPKIEYLHFGYIFGAETYEENSLKIPDSLKSVTVIGSLSIADNAFSGCGLEFIGIAEGVKSIGDNAFKGCAKLQNIEFKSGILSIGDEAFNGYSLLTDIDIPDSVTAIGFSAFGGCASLGSMTLPYVCGDLSGGYEYFGYIFGAETFRQNVAKVPASLKSVTVIGSREIADNAFFGCNSVETVKICKKVKIIGKDAFKDCTALSSAVLETGLIRIGDGAFYGCAELDGIVLGKGINNIGEKAFYGCISLGTVHYNGTLAEFGATEYADKYSSPIAYNADLYIGGKKIKYS